MTLEVLLYIAGAALVPTITWAVIVYLKLAKLQDELRRLLVMHENPENTGFGTVGLKDVIEQNTRAIRSLTHYVVWLSKNMAGQTPPPDLDEH